MTHLHSLFTQRNTQGNFPKKEIAYNFRFTCNVSNTSNIKIFLFISLSLMIQLSLANFKNEGKMHRLNIIKSMER